MEGAPLSESAVSCPAVPASVWEPEGQLDLKAGSALTSARPWTNHLTSPPSVSSLGNGHDSRSHQGAGGALFRAEPLPGPLRTEHPQLVLFLPFIGGSRLPWLVLTNKEIRLGISVFKKPFLVPCPPAPTVLSLPPSPESPRVVTVHVRSCL